ncbi:GAF domain-containing sensor histidine kinase [Stutzerimonas stutzeri]|uniref:GAF domain-containing sensor histidine kinase n=1 Tax=Stutzerimonas stutzeri TaxID=316 RepID=UPI00210D42FE|nr:GAF domain-containing sensor histidine kinase [Stutzerimonas stutzeri]MCQ4257067.1 GAF domain-containing sensor histidine kinase [Stutzerimonas stutzeri]
MKRSVTDDISAISRINAVPAILQVISDTTGLRFAAVARVTDDSWTACAVLDRIDFGMQVGSELDVATTLCHEIYASHETIVISKVSEDERYCDHHTPKIYGFESYVSSPVFRTDGSFFGTVCALDPHPANLPEGTTRAMIESFAKLLGIQLEAEERFEATEAALMDARQTAELREQFIALLGHDLRNPLSSIMSGAQLMLRRSKEPAITGIAEHMLTATHRASRLVDDVLDFARGRLGNGIPLNIRDCDKLHETLAHIVSEMQSSYPQRRLRCEIESLATIRCDSDRLAQLLSNLLANALTHGASDGVVRVSARIEAGHFILAVNNPGEPIPAERLAHLFQPYWREPSSTQSGLGLGLYIANEIALSHGGGMQATSTSDAGTTFIFSMPTGTAAG